MIRLIVILSAVCLLPASITGQTHEQLDRDYEHFKKVYKAAMSDYDAPSPDFPDTLDKSPEILPEWLKMSPENNRKYYIPGISTPGLPDSMASRQARINALMLLALMKNGIYFDMNDYFVNSKADLGLSSKFNKITEFKAFFTYNPAELKEIEHTITRFDEKVYLFEWKTDSSIDRQMDSLVVEGFTFLTEYQKQSRYQQEFILDYSAAVYRNDTKQDSCNFKNITIGNISEINYQFNDSSQKLPRQYYKYRMRANDVADADTTISSKLYYGLWNALITNVLFHLTRKAEINDVIISSTADNYRQKKNIYLNRQLADYRMRAKLNTICISGNDLMTNIQIIKQ